MPAGAQEGGSKGGAREGGRVIITQGAAATADWSVNAGRHCRLHHVFCWWGSARPHVQCTEHSVVQDDAMAGWGGGGEWQLSTHPWQRSSSRMLSWPAPPSCQTCWHHPVGWGRGGAEWHTWLEQKGAAQEGPRCRLLLLHSGRPEGAHSTLMHHNLPHVHMWSMTGAYGCRCRMHTPSAWSHRRRVIRSAVPLHAAPAHRVHIPNNASTEEANWIRCPGSPGDCHSSEQQQPEPLQVDLAGQHDDHDSKKTASGTQEVP
jgi:hypothetical protein